MNSCGELAGYLYGAHFLRVGSGPLVVVATTAPLHRAYGEMLALVPLAYQPRLVVVDWAGGVGGFFTPGYVVVGLREVKDIAKHLLRHHASAVRQAFSDSWFDSVRLWRELVHAVGERIVAHELGHALLAEGFQTPYPYDEEAAADYLAGMLGYRQAKNRRLGEAMFHSLGCTGDYCTHPQPRERAEAYRRGHDDMRDAVQSGDSRYGLDVQFIPW